MSFNAREATVASVHQALYSGTTRCRQIVEAFITRIERHNHTLNAIISLNPHVLKEADALDKRLEKGEASGLLFGVPILLKDNFDAVGMATTAGSLALKDAQPTVDANVVRTLRSAGALILGKTNLHEFALEGLTVSSLGGQTLNPYDLTRTPGGSSGGSGAAVAASFAVMATGSDTVNSLRSPASANSLYSFRPTRGLISCNGVVPVGSTQDTVGMICRSLQDLTLALTVMSTSGGVEIDKARSGAAVEHRNMGNHFTQDLTGATPTQLKKLRIGIIHGFFDYTPSPETTPVNDCMYQVQLLLEAEGAALISVNDNSTFNAPDILLKTDVQMYEIRDLMNSYLRSPRLGGSHPASFEEIFTTQSDPNFLVIPSQYPYIHTALTSSASTSEYIRRKDHITDLTRKLHEVFETHYLDAIIYPQQRNLVVPLSSPNQHGRNGILAAVTGFPVICIPIGFSPPTTSALMGLPIGMEILGLPCTEGKLLKIAKEIDGKLNARRPPASGELSRTVETNKQYDGVPSIVPLGLSSVNVEAYPPGRCR